MSNGLALLFCLGFLVAVWYLGAALIDGWWPFPKLVKPPHGMRWELREVHGGRWHDMHLVNADGESVGSFIACSHGNPTDYWRMGSAEVVHDYKRLHNPGHLPEVAGYTKEEK